MKTTERLTIEQMASHIKWAYKQCDGDLVYRGCCWYIESQAEAMRIAETTGVSLTTTALVISALSPATNWEQNLADAESFIKSPYDAVVSTYGNNRLIAHRVLNGVIEELNGLKTRAFAHLIAEPDSDYIVLDRHAISVALGHCADERERKYYAKTGYSDMESAYRLAAEDLGLLPADLQAITWLWYRENHNRGEK